MEKLLLLYLHNKRSARILFLSILLLQIIIGFFFYENPSYDSNFTHLMYLTITLSAFFFPIGIALGQSIISGIIMAIVYVLTNGSRNGDVSSYVLLTFGYFISATLIIGLLKSKIVDFYLRREEIFYFDEYTGLRNLSALFRDINFYINDKDVEIVQFLLVEIVNQREISAAFGMQLYYKLQKALVLNARDFFRSEIRSYQVRMGTVAILFPPNEKLDFCSLPEKPTQTLVVDNIPIFFNIVVGECEIPRDGKTAEEIFQKAFMALNEAYRKDVNYYKYSSDIKPPSTVCLLGQLQEAMKNQEIVFYYQPILGKKDSVHDIEALVRWNHPVLGLLLPSTFIPDLELTEISDSLVDYALEYNLHNLKQLISEGFDLHMAINVSIRNLEQHLFSQKVLSSLERFQLPPTSLVLEITERGFLADAEESNRNISELSKKGVSFHIDDFGVGFTSLGNLRKFGIRSIKIDQSFISNMKTDKINRALVKSVIGMAKAIDISTVAEGVESMEMFEDLKKMGVDYFQGYAIANPMPMDELRNWLNKYNMKNRKEAG